MPQMFSLFMRMHLEPYAFLIHSWKGCFGNYLAYLYEQVPSPYPPWDYLARKMHHFHWKNSGLNRKQNTFHGWTKLLINIPIKWADNRGNEYTPLTNLGPCAKAKYLGYKSMYARWCLTINSLWQRTMVNCQQH